MATSHLTVPHCAGMRHEGCLAVPMDMSRQSVAGRCFSHCNTRQVAIGLLGLVAGFLFYAMFRTNSPAVVQRLVGSTLHVTWTVPQILQPSFQSLPTALHVFSFALLSIGLAGLPSFRAVLGFSLGWTGINILFELLQGLRRTAAFQATTGVAWEPEALQHFIANGVFDVHDIVAALAGGAVAVVVAVITRKKGDAHAI